MGKCLDHFSVSKVESTSRLEQFQLIRTGPESVCPYIKSISIRISLQITDSNTLCRAGEYFHKNSLKFNLNSRTRVETFFFFFFRIGLILFLSKQIIQSTFCVHTLKFKTLGVKVAQSACVEIERKHLAAKSNQKDQTDRQPWNLLSNTFAPQIITHTHKLSHNWIFNANSK